MLVSEIYKQIHDNRPTNCSVTVLTDLLPKTSHIFATQPAINHQTTRKLTTALDISLLFITFPSSSLSFSPIKQSFQLASKLCAELGWGPSKPPVCRQV